VSRARRPIVVLSFETIAFGVPAGTNTPSMPLISYAFNPDSASVGTLGSSGLRVRPVVASARSRPDSI
jgi:hypothetical protein